MLVFGSALYGSAEVVHDGDILNAGTNISVTKNDTTKTITISTDGVATSAEVDAVKTDVQNNQTAIAANTDKIADNSTEIANNKVVLPVRTIKYLWLLLRCSAWKMLWNISKAMNM